MDQLRTNLHNFRVKAKPTIEEFETMKYLDRRIFRETAKKRFTKLDCDYIHKKHTEEKFPIEGNDLLGKLIFEYLKKRLKQFQTQKEIILVDIGSAGGALTTIFALKALNLFGLLSKTKIILVDVAEKALHSTLLGKFYLSEEFIQQYNLHGFEKGIVTIKEKLSTSEYYCADLLNLPSEIKEADICISGFTHHHLNIFDKELACREMERITRPGGFIGVTDESLTREQYLDWLNDHKKEINIRGEKVPIAQEAFIYLQEHIQLFRNIKIIKNINRDKYYCFYGVKK